MVSPKWKRSQANAGFEGLSDLSNDERRLRCRCKMGGNLHAAHLDQAPAIPPHFGIIGEPVADVLEDLCGAFILRFDDSIVHPFALAPSADNPRFPQVGQMPRYLWLMRFEDFDEVADAHFIFSHQVQKP